MSVPQVSVALPLFGDHHAVQTFPAVCRAWLQQDVPCEVVVAVAAGTAVPALRNGAADDRVRIVPAEPAMASPGPLRNLAVSAARAPVLYLSDADIAPLGSDFVRRALGLREDRVVLQPWMYRLVNPADVPGEPLFQPPGRVLVCHVTGDRDGRLTPVDGERFTWLGPTMMVAEPPPGVGWRNADGTPWHPYPFHWGGILLDRKTFDAVGGYCTRYVGWGCEDDDLIAKLEGRARIVRAWRVSRRLTCLHFEHPRSHTLANIQANNAILAERLAAGVDAMIDEDR
jgi:N-terminal domain of galactosyltransferase